MTTAQTIREELLDTIRWMGDLGELTKLKAFVDTEIAKPTFPSDEELIRRAALGQVEIEAGNFYTLEEFKEMMSDAKERGLAKRGARGESS